MDECCEINRRDITDEWRRKFPDLDDLTLNITYTFMVKGSLGIIEEWVNNDFSQPADFISLSICDMYAAVLAKLDSMQKSQAVKKAKSCKLPIAAGQVIYSFVCFVYQSSSSLRTAINASCGTSTVPNWRIRFLPSFCFSSSFFFRVMSPP